MPAYTNVEEGDPPGILKYRVTGMDCPSCVSKIKNAVSQMGGHDVEISVVTQTMSLKANELDVKGIEEAVTTAGYHLDRIVEENAESSNGDVPSHLTPAYRRALWVVVALNVGYGVVEMVGGFISDSQALKADALDFVGDGLITLMGIVAIGWGLVWRARMALVQSLFLGAMGMGVLITTIYRFWVVSTPDAVLMGAFGVVALLVNIGAALVLIPHRAGDANVRAIWLFSRNDAIGNAAVIAAAGLVTLLGTNLPDLVVAVAIAGLFIQSSWSIARDARNELNQAAV